MKSIIIIFLSLLGLASSTGCVGGGGEPLTEETAGTIITGLASNALSIIPTSGNAPALPIAGITTSSNKFSTKALACETITPTILLDADGDGIAAIKNYSFDCTNESSGDSSITRKGTISITDKDDSVANLAGGLRYEFAITKFRSEDTLGNISDNTYSGFWDFVFAAGKLTSTSEFNGSYFFESPNNNYLNDYNFAYTWDYSLIADDSNNPFTTGSVEFSGTYTMEGKFIVEVNNQHKNYEGSWQVSYYSENLIYNSTCSRWYNTGSIKISDGSGSIYELRYSCNSAKFYVDGKESNLYQP
ncbi:MAG: hypothetical protein H6625_10500 [Bdellovibrionaceae bacterium]|nr:hypothetical protein [Pseudobdellovibrionaceae bacterium]